ncbi:MAG: DUF6370 family protein [Flavobacterium sp.]|uniref:DUF6370 family protein n=1 Tax=Flavobacterium sp. TaxID=239 RepID=UPI003263A4AF
MKKIATLLLFLTAFLINAQEKKSTQKIQLVEVSCGQCKFGMTPKGCDLAVRIGGKSYFVDGVKIDEHGDAHAKDGFCEAIRTAEVIGEIKKGRFVVSYFKLLPKKM